MLSSHSIYTLSNTVECNTSGSIRLEDGQNMFEGRVEVCDDNKWKTVFRRTWDQREAAVVCRQLGRFNQSTPSNNINIVRIEPVMN